MKIAVAVACVALVALFLGADVEAGKVTAAPSKCPQCADAKYDPICVRMGGTDKEPKLTTFGSECVLRAYNCEKATVYPVQKTGECPPGSPVRLS